MSPTIMPRVNYQRLHVRPSVPIIHPPSHANIITNYINRIKNKNIIYYQYVRTISPSIKPTISQTTSPTITYCYHVNIIIYFYSNNTSNQLHRLLSRQHYDVPRIMSTSLVTISSTFTSTIIQSLSRSTMATKYFAVESST